MIYRGGLTTRLNKTAVSSYPSNIRAANVSKQTTRKQIISIGDFDKEDFKLSNINFIQGNVNAIEYCSDMFNFPKATSVAGGLIQDIELGDIELNMAAVI